MQRTRSFDFPVIRPNPLPLQPPLSHRRLCRSRLSCFVFYLDKARKIRNAGSVYRSRFTRTVTSEHPMHASKRPWLLYLALISSGAGAQMIVHNDEHLAADRPEAWAMNYVTASTFMTAFGESRPLAPGQWSIAAELGLIPRLSDT